MSIEKPLLAQVAKFRIFEDLEHSNLDKLLKDGQSAFFQHRQMVFEFSKSAKFFGLLIHGSLKISRMNPQGADTILGFALAGDVVGALTMTMPQPQYPASISSIGHSTVLLLPKETYLEHWTSHTKVIERVQQIHFRRMTLLHEHKVMQRSNLSARIASCLLSLSSESASENGIMVPIPLTRKEISEVVGTTVESAIRVMSEWEKQGIIRSEEHGILIIRPETLRQAIDGVG